MIRKLLLVSLIAVTVASGQEITFDGGRCLCHEVKNKFNVNPRDIKTVEIYPVSASCENIEVVITLKTGIQQCLDPKVKKIQEMFSKLQKKKNHIKKN
ncbi:C-X-C motif chemokine 10-like [Protopterus annectens]|uniref:C-X-C motif chemokine 10-like n=1 Tax=Protopterus annectens TaxID=7888 RepID=UPI001CF986E3|nr:C-X-C motif chemokine 10-like [Protopterus annectens]